MKLQKHISRKIKNKTYTKWMLTIPNSVIYKLDWKAGAELKEEVIGNKLIVRLSNKGSDEKIKLIKEPRKLTAFEKLTKIYNSLPLAERRLTIVVIRNNPISWDMAYKELKYNTRLGKLIGEKLIKLKII